MVLTWNGMGIAVKIWDKYPLAALEMGNFTRLRLVKFSPFPIQHSWYLSQISLLPMLLHIQIVGIGQKLCTFLKFHT